jgi:hypothetical protein
MQQRGQRKVMVKHPYGAVLVLLWLWLTFWIFQFLFQVGIEGESMHAFMASSFENLQSEMFQILVAAWVFKHFLWKGSPESKE